MTVKIGDKIPSCTLKVMGDAGPQDITTSEIFDGKKVAMFALPGAFTPGCSLTHLPGFVVNADKIKARGVDSIVCVSVNDAFVMDAWGKSQNADEILMLADGNGELSDLLGVAFDASGFGMGTRSQRYSMLVDNGEVVQFNLESGGGVDVSSAENLLAAL
jgi:peroxiredoxin